MTAILCVLASSREALIGIDSPGHSLPCPFRALLIQKGRPTLSCRGLEQTIGGHSRFSETQLRIEFFIVLL